MKGVVASPNGRLLPASLAAVRLGIGYDALRTQIATGRIAVVRHASGRLQGIYESDCDEWIERHRRGVTTVTPSHRVPRDVDERVRGLVGDHEREFGGR